jgi:hypothetical protein
MNWGPLIPPVLCVLCLGKLFPEAGLQPPHRITLSAVIFGCSQGPLDLRMFHTASIISVSVSLPLNCTAFPGHSFC